jgi:type II secretory pathway pseudopilin PulG
MNRTRTWPLFVRASLGSIRPIVVVKETRVPFCTGVPAPAVVVLVVEVPGVPVVPFPVDVTPFSITFATISISLLSGTVFAVANRLMTEPVGASNGTLSHASANERIVMAPNAAARLARGFICATMNDGKDNTLMCLEGGQGSQRGYAMAALLVGIGVMMLLMSVAMPVWRTQAQREKEAELVFRGEQIARGINLYTRKMGGGNFPPNIDVLVQGRFLRKKYKDPMTESGEWDLILAGGGVPGQGGPQQQPQPGRGRSGPSTGLSAPPSRTPPAPTGMGSSQPQSPFSVQPQSPFSGGQAGGGLMGVRSKSKQSAFRLYKGSGTHYNEWQFLFSSVSNRPGLPGGQGAPGFPGRPGGPGGRGIGPGIGPRGPRGSGPGVFTPGMGGRRGGGG